MITARGRGDNRPPLPPRSTGDMLAAPAAAGLAGRAGFYDERSNVSTGYSGPHPSQLEEAEKMSEQPCLQRHRTRENNAVTSKERRRSVQRPGLSEA